MSYKYCCDDFESARRWKTDNEEHGELIEIRDGRWHIGSNLPPIEHCPWCGVKLRAPPNQPGESRDK
jgi:hypothetical protein